MYIEVRYYTHDLLAPSAGKPVRQLGRGNAVIGSQSAQQG